MQLPEDLKKKLEEFGQFNQISDQIAQLIAQVIVQDELPKLSEGFMAVLSALSSDICQKELPWIPDKLTIREAHALFDTLLYHVQLGRITQHLVEKGR